MFLKSIEIRGFKSFADKTELNFKQGVTAVVGPNGSGKSNISDAVRWVLGEQSVKSLRGDKMEDVIFAGTQYRKAVGLAQVSLTLDNSDSDLQIEYSDVTISRRLYRSGESEYLINNTTCRLKDVQALFMDTGIGKEGYSIIGQGKIDAILSGKPEERRKLLEEAAGIVKYKTRKEEAEKKLQNTEDNLVRINDIIHTYEERVEPLEKESEKAKTFLKLSEELKVNEINIIIDFIEKTKSNISDLNIKIKNATIALESGLREKETLKKELHKWNTELEEFDNKVSQDKQLYYDNKGKHQNILSEINLMSERIQGIDNNILRVQNEIEDFSNRIEKENEKIDELELQLYTLKEQQKNINNEIFMKEEEINKINQSISTESSNLKGLEEKKVKLLEGKNAQSNNINVANNNMEVAKETLENLKINVESYNSSIIINNGTKTSLIDEVERSQEKISAFEEEVKENKKNIGRLKHSLTLSEKKLKEITMQTNKHEANLNALISLENQYEGYNKSVKNLMQHLSNGTVKNIKGNCYVLGEIIKVNQKFETAIEIAIGGAISNVITEEEESAKELINYLKSRNLGRATFLPMNIVRGRVLQVEQSIKNKDGYIGIASELIEFEDKFKGVMDYVLGKTIICNNMDQALQIAKATGYKHKIVTLDGEIINPGGALTGGSIYSKTASIIGRKREIEVLTVKVKENNQEIVVLSEEVRTYNEGIKTLDERNLNLRDEIHFESIEVTKIQGKINSITEDTLKLTKSLEKSTVELNSIMEKLVALELSVDDYGKELIEIEDELITIESNYELLNKEVKQGLDIIDSIKNNLTDLKIKRAQIDESINNKFLEIQRLKTDIVGYNQKIEELRSEVKNYDKTKEIYFKSLEENNEKVKVLMEELESLELKFKDNEIERIKFKDQINLVNSQIETLTLEFEKIEKEYHRHQVSLVKIETEEQGLLEKLNEEYELTYAEALKYKEHIVNISMLKEKVLNLKREISSLGVVNVGAIEEFKEVKEKFIFMSNQREDLVNAKEELIKVICEMTEKMKVVFRDNFEKLRVNFEQTFRELFKGGRADLILQDGDELTSKIEINVEPPGKKLQNINLMSGGEKVLSAIALLFAILKMKPTPFCILDEIEAALDDANVIRYAEFLRKFSKNIQFIVITHRKGTMEASDMLYGVTMEEKGVSKVVSVNLTR
ncbi:chromosome segregation protein SMC [Clostridium sp. UBA4548]|uniref:chromosome segregation protein SMC n=1 Tax=Clostridium sp. UBA4548 TaxID=1946361 RepID=UPI0025BA7C0C|nr:chromosome segregation protein SMC [Clostridium sp. UBA4548]